MDGHAVGSDGVTRIGWGHTNGSMADLLTVQVYRADDDGNEYLFREVPFINTGGVEYVGPTDGKF